MNNRAYVATRKGLFTLDWTAGKWTVARAAFLGDPVTAVLPNRRDGAVYAAVGHGHFGAKLHRSTDDGQNWSECSAPAYPKPPENEELIRCPSRGIEIPWSVELIWALESGGPDLPGLLWCGTIPGGLFRSGDHGATWQLVRSLWNHPSRKHWFGGGYDYPGIHSICVHPDDSQHVAVGISCGGIWFTEDGGESWTCNTEGMYAEYMPPDRRNDPYIQDPHRVVQCHAAPACLWVQHHNGVFRSTDGGKSWRDVPKVEPSTFGFAVAVHPADPRVAWLVPGHSDQRRIAVDGKVVVAQTRDGGESFETLRDGLPQSHAYDIVFRHALDVDDTGDRLMFGSTTGSLWASDDQGDHWSCISANLPPVHVVRFV